MTAMLRLVPPLARLTHDPEMTPVVPPYPLLPAVCGVALMPVTFDDDFYETIREFAIPPSSVSYVMQVSLWSARNSRSGFAPATVRADFTDDPDRDEGPLFAAGIVRRARKGGIQIVEGRGVTIVNASDAEAKRAKARESGRERAQRHRDKQKAGLGDAIRKALPVTPASRGEPGSVTPTKRVTGRKPQVSGASVTRYAGTSSRVTPPSDRSDLDQSSSGVSQVNARACADPAVIAAVIKTVAGRIDRIITAEGALAAIGRAIARPKTPKRIFDPEKYLTAVFENEEDLYAELLCPPAAALEAALAEPDPDRPDTERHPYVEDPRTGACKCDKPKFNWRHELPEEEARPA